MRSLLPCLLILLLVSCSSPKPVDEVSAREEATRQGDSMRAALKTQRLYELEIAADSMLDDFEPRTFSGFALGYLHYYWKGVSRQKKNTLVAFADYNGRFALVSCLEKEHTHLPDHMIVFIGKDSIETYAPYGGPFFGSQEELLIDRVPSGEDAILFDGINSVPIGKAIAEHLNEMIVVKIFYYDELTESYELTPENKEAIAATYRLSMNFHEASELRSELNSAQ